jgi:hypothetical protein
LDPAATGCTLGFVAKALALTFQVLLKIRNALFLAFGYMQDKPPYEFAVG